MRADIYPLQMLLLTVSGWVRTGASRNGEVVCDERLGGLLKCYRRAA